MNYSKAYTKANYTLLLKTLTLVIIITLTSDTYHLFASSNNNHALSISYQKTLKIDSIFLRNGYLDAEKTVKNSQVKDSLKFEMYKRLFLYNLCIYNYTEAVKLNDSIKKYTAIGNHETTEIISNNNMVIKYFQGTLPEKYYQKTLSYINNLSNNIIQTCILLNFQFRTKDYPSFKQNLEKVNDYILQNNLKHQFIYYWYKYHKGRLNYYLLKNVPSHYLNDFTDIINNGIPKYSNTNMLYFSYLHIGQYYKSQKNYEKALTNYRKSLNHFPIEFCETRCNLLIYIASVHAKTNDMDSCYHYFDLAKDLAYSSNRYILKAIVHTDLLKELRQINNAKRLNQEIKALEDLLHTNTQPIPGLYDILVNLIYEYYQVRDYTKIIQLSEVYLQHTGIMDAKGNYNLKKINNPRIVINPTHIIGILNLLSNSYYQYWNFTTREEMDLRKAYELSKIAASAYEYKFYNHYSTDEEKILYIKNTQHTYSIVLHLGYNLWLYYQKSDSLFEELFYYAEHSRSQLFRLEQQSSKALKLVQLPFGYITKQNQYKRKLDSLKCILPALENNLDVLQTQTYQDYFSYKESLDSLKYEIDKKFTDFVAIKHTKQRYPIEQIRNLMKDEDALLSYGYTPYRICYFYIDKDDMHITHYDLDTSTIMPNLRSYYHMVSNGGQNLTSLDEYANFIDLSQKMYYYFMKPFENYITDKRLHIIPDRLIAILPFDLLLNDSISIPKRKFDYKNLPFLFKRHPISIYYTAEQFLQDSVKTLLNPKLSTFAPSYDFEIQANNKAPTILPPLKNAMDESNDIAKLLNGKAFCYNKAVKSRFIKSLANSEIVHLALHTDMSIEDPVLSKFYFSKTSKNDPNFFTYELYNKKVTTSLLTINGCSSGIGKFYPGEGIINLAHNFFNQGIQNIVLTQWPVSDKSGAAIMKSFYGYLNEGYQTDAALQKAKIKYLSESSLISSNPFYWANYQCVGKPVILKFPQKKTFKNVIALTLLSTCGLMALIYFFKYRRTK
ncbi:MAG: CHAT domain-containing protein [Bacteroidales bacterium]|nr:CHAT domain-containing protein [Bacteroidales bacterium]